MIALTPLHAEAMAAIHAASFPPGECWSAAAMAEMLAMPGAFGFLEPAGALVLARLAGGEAEILTLATVPAARRRGVARRLLAAVLARCGEADVFLEVEAANAPALALYAAAGFVPCGSRPGYYGAGRPAVVLRRQAAPPGKAAG